MARRKLMKRLAALAVTFARWGHRAYSRSPHSRTGLTCRPGTLTGRHGAGNFRATRPGKPDRKRVRLVSGLKPALLSRNALFASLLLFQGCLLPDVRAEEETATKPQHASPPPHIVVFLSDDHSQFDSSLYGNFNFPTPNFERMAAEGMMLTHCFVASPSCAPSRAAMLTGLMPARNGAEGNHTYPKPGIEGLVGELEKLGYETAAFGKVAHGRSEHLERWGFDFTPRTGRKRSALRKGVQSFLKLKSRDESRRTKPLCLFVGTSDPHVPWTEESRFKPERTKLPPHHLDTPETRRHHVAYKQEVSEIDELLDELRAASATNLGDNVFFLHTSDHGSQWPFGKWTLYDYGTRVPFIAAWPGRIKPGSRSDAMVSWVDLLPTLIEAAGGEAPRGLDGKSFLPVLLGEKKAHREHIFTTHSGDVNVNVYPSRAIRTREWKLIHNLRPEFAFTTHSDLHRKPQAGAYWGEWVELAKMDQAARTIVDRYYRRPEFELYHVAEDRWELDNLAQDPKHADRVVALKRDLAGWMKAQGDTGRIFGTPRPLEKRESWHPDHFDPAKVPQAKRKGLNGGPTPGPDRR